MNRKTTILALLIPALTLFTATAQDQTAEKEPQLTTLEQLQKEANALRPLVKSQLANQMLDAVKSLPTIATRTIYYDRDSKTAVRADRVGDIDPATLESWKKLELDEGFYYYTRYGTPLASLRAFDLAAQAGRDSADGMKILDFGYGSIGQLRLLASLGAHTTGVEVDPILRELYSYDGDTGSIARADGPPGNRLAHGTIQLVHGQWPADKDVVAKVAGEYDLFISKNTLKRGYIHPEREVDPRMLVHLDVDDATYVKAIYDALKPGGLAIIYNICPALSKPDEPYKPWSDGRCPFQRDLIEKTGFEVLEYDEDDTAFVKMMAKALEWDASMDVENDLFAHYTLLRKPVK